MQRVARAGDACPPVERVDLIAPGSAGDVPARLTQHWLIDPLASALREQGAPVTTAVGLQPTKAFLKALLTRKGSPGLFFFAGHGLGFPCGDSRQAAHQGALLCADWPGPQPTLRSGSLTPDLYLSGDDIADTACPGVSLAVLYASYSAAVPQLAGERLLPEAGPIAARSLIAGLPQHLLGSPGDGPLAVIGMADRVWGWAVDGPRREGPTTLMRSLLLSLLNGRRIGAAMEVANERYVELSTLLSDELEEIEFGKSNDPGWLADLWMANNDARFMILLGDPAVQFAPRGAPPAP